MKLAIGIGALILIATLTPGPNNLMVLQLAGARGVRAALPAIAGIVAGGLGMIALARIGLDTAASHQPLLQRGIVAAGAAYLGALGLGLVYRSFGTAETHSASRQTSALGAPALFVLQFANPKAYVLVLTVTAAARAAGAGEFLLPLLFVAISSSSLLAWAVLGRGATRILRSRLARARFDRVMGVLLIASAGSLALGNI